MRIRFTSSENDGYVNEANVGNAADAVARRIARETNLIFCAGPRVESFTSKTVHYEGTLGRKARTGGYIPVRRVMFTIYRPSKE